MNTIKLAVANTESPTQSLMDELRAVISKETYDHVTLAALLGILELLKAETLERAREEA